MKRLLNIVAVFVTLSLLIFGAFLLWNLSNQTTEVLETPQTGRVAANDVYLPLIEQGQSEGVAAISTPTAEGDVPVQVLSNPEGACLRVEDGKFLFDLVGYLENGDGTTRIIYMITNQSDETARTVSFTNEKWRIVSPQKEEKAMGVHDRYEVSVAETRQGTALTFAASQEGFTGSMEMFVMTVSDFDLKSTVDISVSTGRDDESLTEAGRAAMVLEGAPCQGSRPTPAPIPTVNTPPPIAWDDPPECVNEPWDHNQWRTHLAEQRVDAGEERRLNTRFISQLQPMSSFLRDETLDSVESRMSSDEDSLDTTAQLKRDVSALWLNILDGRLKRATEISFERVDVETVGELLALAEEYLEKERFSSHVQDALDQLLAGQGITRSVCAHMIHMRLGQPFEESIRYTSAFTVQKRIWIHGQENFRLHLAHMEPSPDYNMIAIESFGYESGGPLFIYDMVSSQLTNLIEEMGVSISPLSEQDKIENFDSKSPWQILGWDQGSQYILLGNGDTSVVFWIDLQNQTYRTIELGNFIDSIASKTYIDLAPDGTEFVYVNRHMAKNSDENGMEILSYNLETSQVDTVLAVQKGEEIRYPRISPGGDKIVYLVGRMQTSPGEGLNFTIQLFDRNTGTDTTLITKDLGWAEPIWSPDGSMIALPLKTPDYYPHTHTFPTSEKWRGNIGIIFVETGELQQITSIDGAARYPVWSFDNRSLAFYTHDGQFGTISLEYPQNIWQIADSKSRRHLYGLTLSLP